MPEGTPGSPQAEPQGVTPPPRLPGETEEQYRARTGRSPNEPVPEEEPSEPKEPEQV